MLLAAASGILVGGHTTPAAAAGAHVQARSREIVSGTTNSLTFANANQAGDLIAVFVIWNNTGSVAISDSRGNTFTAATPRTTWGQNWSAQTFYASGIASGTNTVTATFATPISGWGTLYLHEYSGLDQVSPVDVTASAIGTGASMSSGSASTSNANDLIFGAGASDSKVNAAGTGFTTRSTAFGNRIEDRSVSAAGSYSATARHNGNRWVMQMVAFKAATTSSDTTPPSQPNGLAATVLSGSQINLAWTASTDNVGVTGYRVFRNGTQIATTTAASYNNTGLTPGTTYSYSITAIDAAGNLSLPSATVSATTTPIADLSLPTVSITGPASATTLTDIVTITADATDNVGVAGVQFLIDGAIAGVEDVSTPFTYAWDTRSATNGSHTLSARARDAAGNVATSTPVTVNVANTSAFQNEVLATGLDLPTSLVFLPDGRMLVTELPGKIKVLSAPYTAVSATPFLALANVGNDGYAGLQQGIFSIALDPSFATNHYYYVFYTLRSPNRDRLSRFTANTNLTGTDLATELVLYQDPQDAHAEHHGGAVMMGNDGKIYFTTGEHFDASDAQRLTNPRGKVHRINPDGSVPTDNPFYDGAGPNVDSIWAYGLRNPYRAYYDQPTGRMYIGDVGGNDAATAKEELDLGQAGANFGWPNSEGTCGGACNPLYFYAHEGRDASITAGFVYHGSQYPSSYQGSFFFADYAQNWIKRLTFDANGRVNGVFNFEPSDGSADGPYGDIVFLTEGPDGALYYIDLGYSDISGTFGVSKIRRIRYLSNNLAPTAVISATPTGGAAPLAVDFSSAGSVDPEGQPLTFSWTFGDGATSASANPSHTYAADGPYVARLTVSDGVNASVSTSLKISVGAVPTATILTPTDQGRFIAGDIISFTGDGIDALDGALPASAYSWTIDFLHGGHVHPGATQTGVKSGSFTIPTTGHDFSGDTRYRVTLTVVNSAGLSASTSVTIYPVKVNLSFATSPPGLTIYVDGIAKTTPFVHDSVPGFVSSIQAPDQATGNTNYRFASWSDGGAQTHNLVAPTTDQSYTATFTQAVVTSPPAFVQVNSVTPQTDQSAVTVTFLSAQTAGSTNVIAIGWNSAAGNVNSVTDSAGNLYQSATVLARGTGLSQTIWYAKNIVAAPAGSNTVTVTLSAAMPYVDVRALEYRGLDPADPVDRTTAASGSSLAANSGPVTTTSANTLIFGAGMTLGTFNAATGGATTRIITQPDADIAQDQIVSATGTYSATANLGSATNWLMQLVAFKAATTSPPSQ
ncbi:MAG: PQQ-dependent sugar dehydrogenase [Vicinamibacterales bacterium]